jgi:hypothetical protein
VPVIKPARKHKYNTKQHRYTKQTLNKPSNKQTTRQTDTNKRKQYYRRRYIKVLGQNPYTLKK